MTVLYFLTLECGEANWLTSSSASTTLPADRARCGSEVRASNFFELAVAAAISFFGIGLAGLRKEMPRFVSLLAPEYRMNIPAGGERVSYHVSLLVDPQRFAEDAARQRAEVRHHAV